MDERIEHLCRDSAYTALGLAVLAFQRLQVERRGLESRLRASCDAASAGSLVDDLVARVIPVGQELFRAVARASGASGQRD